MGHLESALHEVRTAKHVETNDPQAWAPCGAPCGNPSGGANHGMCPTNARAPCGAPYGNEHPMRAVSIGGGGAFGPHTQTNLGVKRKSLIFFIWRKSLICFFFRRKSSVEKKTPECMVRDLRFFCDATYT